VFILLLAHFRWPWPIWVPFPDHQTMRVSESIGPQLPQPFLLPPPTATLFSFFVAGRSFSGCASRLERPTAEGTSGSAFSLGNCLISDLVVDKTDDKNAFLRQLGVSVI
jgi:hypothetical protein